VTIRDLEGIDHTVSVTASTLDEAVALGIASLRGEEWVAGSAYGPAIVKVAVTNMWVEHHVTVKDFRSWLERRVCRRAMVPREIRVARQRVSRQTPTGRKAGSAVGKL
jgi:hypothetical protein